METVLVLVVLIFTNLSALYQSSPVEVHEDYENQHDEGELLMLQVITRHGDRTPAFAYPTDPYANFDYPEGFGNLVNLGKQRMYRFGSVLRRRYLNYIANTLTRNVLSQSSPIRRCIESEQALLTGLFPPRVSEIWSHSPDYPEDVLAQIWQPISVQTVELSRAWKLADAPCPKADQIDAQLPDLLPDLKKFLNENEDFIQNVSQYSGLEPFSWRMVGYIQDTTNVEREYFGNEFVSPFWYDKIGPDTEKRMNQFLDLNFRIYEKVSTKYLKLRSGTFLGEVIENFKANLDQNVTNKNRKLFTYSSHDSQVGFILHALGLYKERPTYGSGLILELRKHGKNPEPMVHLLYANVTNNYQISELKLNESPRFAQLCTKSYCSLSNFEDSLVNLLETDVENDCKI